MQTKRLPVFVPLSTLMSSFLASTEHIRHSLLWICNPNMKKAQPRVELSQLTLWFKCIDNANLNKIKKNKETKIFRYNYST